LSPKARRYVQKAPTAKKDNPFAFLDEDEGPPTAREIAEYVAMKKKFPAWYSGRIEAALKESHDDD
jgi:hypothetical protein